MTGADSACVRLCALARARWRGAAGIIAAVTLQATAVANDTSPRGTPPELYSEFIRGWTHYCDGRYSEAAVSFQRANSLDRRFRPARIGIRACLQGMGLADLELGVDAFEQWLTRFGDRLTPFDPELSRAIAFWGVYQEDGKHYAGITELEAQIVHLIAESAAIPVVPIEPLTPRDARSLADLPYAYNLLAMVHDDGAAIRVSLQLIYGYDMRTSRALHVAAGPEEAQQIGLDYREVKFDLTRNGLTDFFASNEGRKAIRDLLADRAPRPRVPFVPPPSLQKATAESVLSADLWDFFAYWATRPRAADAFQAAWNRPATTRDFEEFSMLRNVLTTAFMYTAAERVPPDAPERPFILAKLNTLVYPVPSFWEPFRPSEADVIAAYPDHVVGLTWSYERLRTGLRAANLDNDISRMVVILRRLQAMDLHWSTGAPTEADIAELDNLKTKTNETRSIRLPPQIDLTFTKPGDKVTLMFYRGKSFAPARGLAELEHPSGAPPPTKDGVEAYVTRHRLDPTSPTLWWSGLQLRHAAFEDDATARNYFDLWYDLASDLLRQERVVAPANPHAVSGSSALVDWSVIDAIEMVARRPRRLYPNSDFDAAQRRFRDLVLNAVDEERLVPAHRNGLFRSVLSLVNRIDLQDADEIDRAAAMLARLWKASTPTQEHRWRYADWLVKIHHGQEAQAVLTEVPAEGTPRPLPRQGVLHGEYVPSPGEVPFRNAMAMAAALECSGEADAAQRVIEKALVDASEDMDFSSRANLLYRMAELLASRGHDDEARLHLDLCLETINSREVKWCRGAMGQVMGKSLSEACFDLREDIAN